MVIPPDGSLPPITRTGFMPFNNVMVVKISKNVGKKDKTVYNLVTLDTSKKGERWPAEISVENTTEVIKKSITPEKTETKCNSVPIEKPEENTVKRQTPFRKKMIKKRRPINNKSKFKNNIPTKVQRYNDVPASEIEPWLPGSGLSTNTVPPMYNQLVPNFFPAPLLNCKGLLGNSPSDIVNNAPIINANLQNRMSKNITSTNLPASDCLDNREVPPVKGPFENTYHKNFRNKLLPNEKYNDPFNVPYRDDGSGLFPRNRNYSDVEREKASISPNFKNRFETLRPFEKSNLRNSYDSNYMGNIGDQALVNHLQDFDGSRRMDPLNHRHPNHREERSHPQDYDGSHRIDPLNRHSQHEESFRGAGRDFPVDGIDCGFPNAFGSGHQQNKFIRNGSCEAFEENVGRYGKDIPFNTGYNEMPRNNFPDFKMGANRDFIRNRRGSKDGSPLNNSYDNYPEMQRKNPADFYGQYENERIWDNGHEAKPSFRDNYRQNRTPFRKRNKNMRWKKNSFRNNQQNSSKRVRR